MLQHGTAAAALGAAEDFVATDDHVTLGAALETKQRLLYDGGRRDLYQFAFNAVSQQDGLQRLMHGAVQPSRVNPPTPRSRGAGGPDETIR